MAMAAPARAAPSPNHTGTLTRTAGTGPPAEAAAHPETRHSTGSGPVPPQGGSCVPGCSEGPGQPSGAAALPSLPAIPPCRRRSHLGGAGPGHLKVTAAGAAPQRPAGPGRPPGRAPLRTGACSPRFPPGPARPAALSRPGPAPTAGIHAAAAMARPAPRPSRPRRHGHSARNREEPGTGTGTSPAPPRPGQPGPRSAVRMRRLSRPALVVVLLRGRRRGRGWSPPASGAVVRATECSR